MGGALREGTATVPHPSFPPQTLILSLRRSAVVLGSMAIVRFGIQRAVGPMHAPILWLLAWHFRGHLYLVFRPARGPVAVSNFEAIEVALVALEGGGGVLQRRCCGRTRIAYRQSRAPKCL